MKCILFFLAAVALAALPGAALAVDANTCGFVQGNGGWYKAADRSGPYSLDGSCNATLIGSASTGSTGSVTAPGTNGSQAQAVQGINGGIPVGISAPTLETSNAAINAATGSQADAASGSGANTTIIGALRAIRDKLLTNVAAIVFVFDGAANRQLASTTTGALAPPTAASGKIVDTSTAVAANTSTQIVAARATPGDRISIEIQCDGGAAVGVDMKGGTLTSATAAPRVIPSGSYPLYTPPVATQTAITAYTGTAQTCRVTEYLR